MAKPARVTFAPVRPDLLCGNCTMTDRGQIGDIPMAPAEAVEGIGEDDEEIEIGSEPNDDVEPMKVAPSPQMPSAAEVEEHRVSHLPFRSWCRECMEGKPRP